MPLNQALLPEFDNEMSNTRKSLERVPDDKLGWKPHNKSMTMGGLAGHLATITHWTEAILGQDSFDVGDAPPQPQYTSRKEILDAFDQNTASARKGHRRGRRRNADEAVVFAVERKYCYDHAANFRPAQLHHEPHNPSSSTIGCLSAIE